jgi:methionyl-tRNA formyltransferase
MSNKYLIVSEKEIHLDLFNRLNLEFCNNEWILINNKFDFTFEVLNKINPCKIFIPHWSYKIPNEIFTSFECILFHMTDLPYGRGGSPLQNLILRGHKSTFISAIKVDHGIDAGDIYLKSYLDLSGTASEIFSRSSNVIFDMIRQIIKSNISPNPQSGEIVEFVRRKPNESNVNEIENLEKLYDFIRMLDCDGYPNAFFETTFFKFEFTKAVFNPKNSLITADVRIVKK